MLCVCVCIMETKYLWKQYGTVAFLPFFNGRDSNLAIPLFLPYDLMNDKADMYNIINIKIATFNVIKPCGPAVSQSCSKVVHMYSSPSCDK